MTWTKTSEEDSQYNCCAYALGFEDRWMWPSEDCVWPRDNPTESLDEFVDVLAMFGYSFCGGPLDDRNWQLEQGFEKIVLYELVSGEKTLLMHVAKQLPDGTWSSKLGHLIDIRHDHPNDLPDAGRYDSRNCGKATYFFKRPRS